MAWGGGGGGKGSTKSDPRQSWARGKATRKTTGRGKGKTTRTTYEADNKNWRPVGSSGPSKMHSEEGWKKGRKAKTYTAGSNILDREKRGTYEESFKSRADDPRNWEFHYKDTGNRMAAGKDMTSSERRTLARTQARGKAERMAKMTGQDVFDIRKIEWETAGLTAGSKQATADRKASGKYGSTRVARNVVAAKRRAGVGGGGGQRRGQGTTSPFDAQAGGRTKSKRMA